VPRTANDSAIISDGPIDRRVSLIVVSTLGFSRGRKGRYSHITRGGLMTAYLILHVPVPDRVMIFGLLFILGIHERIWAIESLCFRFIVTSLPA
jgi:hypothetical protein